MKKPAETTTLGLAFIASAVCGILAVIVIGDNLDHRREQILKPPAPPARIAATSSVDALDRMFARNTSGLQVITEPTVVWMDTDTGAAYTEEAVAMNLGVTIPEARVDLAKNGYRRFTAECHGITRADHTWSFGYCTYKPAPIELEG